MLTDAPPEAPVIPVTTECVAAAAAWQKVPLDILQSILAVEGGQVGQVSENTNGTVDIGPAQINTLWLPVLAEQGITGRMLRDNGCVNVYAASWILKTHIVESGGDIWAAVGRYHSRNARYADPYRQRVASALVRIQKQTRQHESSR